MEKNAFIATYYVVLKYKVHFSFKQRIEINVFPNQECDLAAMWKVDLNFTILFVIFIKINFSNFSKLQFSV